MVQKNILGLFLHKMSKNIWGGSTAPYPDLTLILPSCIPKFWICR